MNPAIYRIYNDQGELIYAGYTAANPAGRAVQHLRDQPWAKEIHNIRVAHFDTTEEAREAEKAAIRSESPKYNKAFRVLTSEEHDAEKIRHREQVKEMARRFAEQAPPPTEGQAVLIQAAFRGDATRPDGGPWEPAEHKKWKG